MFHGTVRRTVPWRRRVHGKCVWKRHVRYNNIEISHVGRYTKVFPTLHTPISKVLQNHKDITPDPASELWVAQVGYQTSIVCTKYFIKN